MNHSFLRNFVLSLMAVLVTALTAPVSVEAVTLPDQKQFVGFRKNKVYTQYDITGDGREDTFSFSMANQGKKNCQLTVTVNDKIVLTADDAYSYKVKLCTLSNGRVYLNVSYEFDDGKWQKLNCLYQYKKGKMAYVTRLLDYPESRYQIYRADVTQVKNNDIIITYTGLNNVVGNLSWTGTYRYQSSSKSFKRTSNIMKVDYTRTNHSNSWISSRAFNTYTTPKCKTTAFRLKKGEVVRINRIASTNQTFCLELIRSNGTRGWISSPKKFQGLSRYITNHNWGTL